MRFLRRGVGCEHVPEDLAVPAANRCRGCGSRFNLRVCAECGYVGCCESQRGHDREHAMESRHPVIRSMGRIPFTWCYACHEYV